MFKSFFSGGNHSKEVQRQAGTLELLLSDEDPRDLLRWFEKNSRKLGQSFIDALADTSERLLQEYSITSTQQLFRLNLLISELFRRQIHAIARKLDESSRLQLILVQKALEEDGVGPRSVDAEDAGDVYKHVYNYRGCCLAEHGKYSASIEHFNATLAIDQHFAPAYCNRARAYVELGRLEEARADCETLRSFDPGYPEGRATYQLVETLRRLKAAGGGSIEKIAEEHGLLELLRTYDRPPKPGEYARSLGQEVNPLEVPELSESNATPEQFNHLGVVRGRSGDYEGAIEAFNRALQLNPQYLEPYYNRGKAYMLAGAFEKAIADFSFILERDPQDVEAYELQKQAFERQERKHPQLDTASLSGEGRQLGEEDQSKKDINGRPKGSDILSRSMPQQTWELPYELDDLAYVGPSAPPRPQVIAAARHLLFPVGLDTLDSAAGANAEVLAKTQYHQATTLRKSNSHQEAVPLYLSALACWAKLDQPEYMSACLNGLGISYKELTREALKRELTALTQTSSPATLNVNWELFSYQLYKSVYRGACDLAEKGRACHRWSLELHKQMGDLAGQANQISNLAMIEGLMGNLDTARHYQLWAAQAHREAGRLADAAIDLMELARLDRDLGDEKAAAARERQSQEIGHARQT